MIYYLYEIKNNINGKIYIGVHKTKDINDGYMGSGKVLLKAIEKHGIKNFTKVILETFDTPEKMYAKELEIVTEEFLSRDDVYNLRRGGRGGFDHINTRGISKFKGKKHSGDMSRFGHKKNNHFAKKNHSENTKRKIAEKLKGSKRTTESIAKQKEVWRLKKLNKNDAGLV